MSEFSVFHSPETWVLGDDVETEGKPLRNMENLRREFVRLCVRNFDAFVCCYHTRRKDGLIYEPTCAFADCAIEVWGCTEVHTACEFLGVGIPFGVKVHHHAIDGLTRTYDSGIYIEEFLPSSLVSDNMEIAIEKARRQAILNFIPEDFLAEGFSIALALKLNSFL